MERYELPDEWGGIEVMASVCIPPDIDAFLREFPEGRMAAIARICRERMAALPPVPEDEL